MIKISISQLSDAYGLTPEALRYYEEKGLIAPQRDVSSGFRIYTTRDVQRVGVIKSLQRQGFSLDEIRKLLTGCKKSEVIALMDEKRNQMHDALCLSQAIYSRLTAGTDLLRDSPSLVMHPRLTEGCACYAVDYASNEALCASMGTDSLIQSLIDALPLTCYCSILPLERLWGADLPIRVGIAAPVEYSAVIHADFSQMHMLAGPRVVRTVFELTPPRQESIVPAEQAALDFIRKNGLTPVCAGYTRQYAWFVDEQGIMRHYGELILPVSL